jgi:glycosyltransferase involved in cell wall biosynthesis
VQIALDATYSLGRNLSGVGVYSRAILFGLARAHPESRFRFCYRPHRFLRSFGENLPPNARRRLLSGIPRADVFHALNQRVDASSGHATPIVATFHDLFVMAGEYSTPEFRARFTAQAREAAERSDVIIAVSAFTASQVEQLLGVDPARIRVVPHGVRIPTPIPASRSDGGAAREPMVLSVGAIQRRKNTARLVKAFERLPQGWRLSLAGAPDGYRAAEELRTVEESPRRLDIDVLGYVPEAQLDDLYRRASIFAFPSLDEGFGLPVLEAMAHGVPVVTSNRSALPEVAGGAALLVDPLDSDAIASALLRLASDPGLSEDLGRQGRERARQFTWESAVERTWAVYREL